MQIESNASAARTAAPGLAQGDLSAPGSLAEPGVVRTPTWVRHNAWRQTAANAANAGSAGTAPVARGWFGRLRHVLLGRVQTAQASSAERLAALSLAPVRGHGFGLLRGLSRIGLRLRHHLATLQARHKADVAALSAPVQSARPAETIRTPAARSESATSTASTSATAATPAASSETDTQALARVTTAMQQRFAAAAQDASGFNATLRQAFGDRFGAARAEALRQQALAGDFSWAPRIQIASAEQLADLSGTQAADGAARGAYVQADDTIYISRETLHGDTDTAQRLLMEELGHAIDARINTVDAAGDEGEIFAKLMHGDAVNAQQLADLKAENDHGTVMLNGRQVQVEYGWFKKLRKAISGGIKKVFKAVVKGAVGLVKSTFKVATGLMTLNFQRVRDGFKDGVQAVKTTVKTVVQAVKETTKAVISAVKEGFKQLMQSKLFAAVLMICRFIPIPVVQLAVRIVDVVRAAYMAYQGIKNKSWGAVLGAVASVAGGAANIAGSLGASLSTVNAIKGVADAASKLSMAYNAIANKDIGAALSLAGGAFGSNTPASSTLATLHTVGGYAQQAVALRSAVRSGDVLGALSGGLSLAGAAAGKDSSYAGQIASASEVVTGLRAAQALSKGHLDAAQSLASGMASAQAASAQADAVFAQQRAQAEAAEAQAKAHADAAAAQAAKAAVTARTDASAAEPTATSPTAASTPAAEAELGHGNAYANGLKTSGLPLSDGLATQAGTSFGMPSHTVASGDTLEAIARFRYGDQWKAGLAQMAIDNKLPLNPWGSPIIQPGKDLIVNDLSAMTEAQLADLSKFGGKIIATNSNGLAVKAELEQRAREAAAEKVAEAISAARQSASTGSVTNQAQPSATPDSGDALAAGRSSMNAYWTDLSDAGVKEGSFVKYVAGQTLQKLGNVGYSLAEMARGVSQQPDQAMAGGVKSLVNLGPDTFNAATHLVKTSADGYTLLAEKLGAGDGTFAGFRDSKPLQITPLATYDNPAQAGGALLTQAALGVGMAKYGAYRIEPDLGTPGTLYANPIPLKLAPPDLAVDATAAATSVSGETSATATGKAYHAERAESRRGSGDFDLVNQPLRDIEGNPVLVSKRVDLSSGEPVTSSGEQLARPDAVNLSKRLVVDDKPLGRPIAKDQQEIMRFVRAFEESQGHPPSTIAIERYDPKTGQPVVTELYKASDFPVRKQP